MSNIEVLGGKWSTDELADILNATEDDGERVPVYLNGEKAGVLSALRQAGHKLYADIRRATSALRDTLEAAVQGQGLRIGTSIWNGTGGLRAVEFSTPEAVPVKSHGNVSAEAVKTYELDGSQLRLGVIEDPGAGVRQEDLSMDVMKVPNTYQGTSAAVDDLARRYAAEHHTTYEAGLQGVKALFPDLWRAYADTRHGKDRIVVFDGYRPPDGPAKVSPSVSGYPIEGTWPAFEDAFRAAVAAFKAQGHNEEQAQSLVWQANPEWRIAYRQWVMSRMRGPS